jgi:hypothetical protein
VQAATAIGQALGSFGGYILRVQAVAGAGFRFKLRPELADLKPLCDSSPEILDSRPERERLRGRLCNGRRSGGHDVQGKL